MENQEQELQQHNLLECILNGFCFLAEVTKIADGENAT